jgi:hypothetical protein
MIAGDRALSSSSSNSEPGSSPSSGIAAPDVARVSMLESEVKPAVTEAAVVEPESGLDYIWRLAWVDINMNQTPSYVKSRRSVQIQVGICERRIELPPFGERRWLHMKLSAVILI